MKMSLMIGGALLSSLALWGVYSVLNTPSRRRVFKDLGERERLSDSEIAAGHPIVGVS